MEKTGNILIADDETTFLESTADLLRLQGYSCQCASDAHKALSLLQSERFDLLIADIKMPGNHDLALIKEIAEQEESMAVILVTGYPNVHTAIDAVNLSVSAYLVKPFVCEELFKHVDKAIGQFTAPSRARALIENKCRELENTLQTFQMESSRAKNKSSYTLNDFMNSN
ncbi:response regulator [Methylomarinum vadi]|uniref:response regulator n=1 Tax=Methylomarinum vadi TaxID=438855 RepID=UPI0004DEDA44|nr:response regulator [Methylomarinum vadi]